MKKPLIALIICTVFLSCTGCVNKEIDDITNKMNTATAQYTSWDRKQHSHWYLEGTNYADGYMTTFEQEETFEYHQLLNGDLTGKGKLVNNHGTSIESYADIVRYQKNGTEYFDVDGERYKVIWSDIEPKNHFGSYQVGDQFTASDFKKISVTELEDGGKKISFILNPSVFPEGTFHKSLKPWLKFLPNELVITDTIMEKFHYTMIIDENYLLKKESLNMDLTLVLDAGYDADVTFSETLEYSNYQNLHEDHIVFPDDLKDYPLTNEKLGVEYFVTPQIKEILLAQ